MIPWRYFFSINGRVTRAQYWLDYHLFFVASGTVMFSLFEVPADGGWNAALILWSGFVIWFGFAMSVKRWHDRDKSGWWNLINVIPFFGNCWTLVEPGFLRGTRGPNSFGPDPLDRASTDAPKGAEGFEPAWFLKWRVAGVRLILVVLAVFRGRDLTGHRERYGRSARWRARRHRLYGTSRCADDANVHHAGCIGRQLQLGVLFRRGLRTRLQFRAGPGRLGDYRPDLPKRRHPAGPLERSLGSWEKTTMAATARTLVSNACFSVPARTS